jgi:hypothetical protein
VIRYPDKYHLSCAPGEALTLTATDNGSGSITRCNSIAVLSSVAVPLAPGTTVLSIVIGYPADSGGSGTVVLASSTGELETYWFTQFHNTEDGCVIEITVA